MFLFRPSIINMRRFVAAILAFAPLLASAFQLPTVPELDQAALLGRYYQVYSNDIVMKSIEMGGHCQTVDFLNVAGAFKIRNSMNAMSETGQLVSLMGTATPNPTEPGKFTIVFDAFPTPSK